jgi:hypothetical protein
MKKEDFIIGKWYVSNQFVNTQAIKVKDVRGKHLVVLERIYENKFISSPKELSYHQDLSSYRRVPLAEIRPYLPDDLGGKLISNVCFNNQSEEISLTLEKGTKVEIVKMTYEQAKAIGFINLDVLKNFFNKF